jgi:hypothetical protein
MVKSREASCKNIQIKSLKSEVGSRAGWARTRRWKKVHSDPLKLESPNQTLISPEQSRHNGRDISTLLH